MKHNQAVGSYKPNGLTSIQKQVLWSLIEVYDDVSQKIEPLIDDRTDYDNGFDEGSAYALGEMVEAIVKEGHEVDEPNLKTALLIRGLLL